MRKGRSIAAAVALAAAAFSSTGALSSTAGIVSFAIAGDAIPEALGGGMGDAQRGLAVIRDRRKGNCLICHSLSRVVDEPFQGEIGPALDGVGRRLSAAQIRLRVVDPARLNPATLMPSYYRVEGLVNVAPEYKGLPVLDAQQIEDIVTYLSSLKE
jgi:sulfur-oxidizing protein SoxX